MQTLQVGEFFNREDIHSIFSPDSTFTPQAGTWGLQGMVRIPSRQGDWVFFVTFGQIQGEHSFDESITHDGVLSWQSQPSQGFKGTFSAEHGIGQSLTSELVRYKSSVEVGLMRQIKAAIDPLGIMNPGKVLAQN